MRYMKMCFRIIDRNINYSTCEIRWKAKLSWSKIKLDLLSSQMWHFFAIYFGKFYAVNWKIEWKLHSFHRLTRLPTFPSFGGFFGTFVFRGRYSYEENRFIVLWKTKLTPNDVPPYNILAQSILTRESCSKHYHILQYWSFHIFFYGNFPLATMNLA